MAGASIVASVLVIQPVARCDDERLMDMEWFFTKLNAVTYDDLDSKTAIAEIPSRWQSTPGSGTQWR